MIKAHKIALLQCVFSDIWDNVNHISTKLDRQPGSVTNDDLETIDLLMSNTLELVALWRATKAEFSQSKEGVKIRD